jgi:hypothetical protein
MASTGVTALADTIFAEIVQSRVLDELRPANTTRDFIWFATKGPSQVASFGPWGDAGAASAITDDLSEIASTAMSDTQASATAAGVGFRIDVTDFVREVNVADVYATASRMVGAALAEKWETDLSALVDDFSNVTTAASTLTPIDLLAAVSALEQRDVPGPYVVYLDPKQTGELRVEIATTTAQYESGGRNADLVSPFAVSGYFGNYMGLPIYQSSLTVTTSSLIGGAVFASQQALGAYEVIGQRIETQRDASYEALEFVGAHWYGFAETSDTRGQTLKSAA